MKWLPLIGYRSGRSLCHGGCAGRRCFRNESPLVYADPRPLFWLSYPYSTQARTWNGVSQGVEVLAGKATLRPLGALPVLAAGAHACFAVPIADVAARAFRLALADDEKAVQALLAADPGSELPLPGRNGRDLWLEWTPAPQGRLDEGGE